VRKVVAYELLSLDGVAEQPDEFVTDFDHVMRENLGRAGLRCEGRARGRQAGPERRAPLWQSSGETATSNSPAERVTLFG